MGDFYAVLDQKVDGFPQGTQTGATANDRLSPFLGEAGLMDIWRAWKPAALLLFQDTLHFLEMIWFWGMRRHCR